MIRTTVELTMTRVSNDTGPDSFVMKGKGGLVNVDHEEDCLWHVRNSNGDVHLCRTTRDDAVALGINLASTAFSLRGFKD